MGDWRTYAEEVIPAGDDLVFITKDPSGTPATRVMELERTPAAMGGIRVSKGTDASLAGIDAATWTQVNVFNAAAAVSPLFEADFANDRLVVNRQGPVLVGFTVSFSGTQNRTYEFEVRLGGIAVDVGAKRKIGTGGDVGSMSDAAPVDIASGGVLTLWIKVDSSASITVYSASLYAVV